MKKTKKFKENRLKITMSMTETAEKATTNMKSHSDLIDKLRETQEKLEEASQKAATNVKTYSQAAATP